MRCDHRATLQMQPLSMVSIPNGFSNALRQGVLKKVRVLVTGVSIPNGFSNALRHWTWDYDPMDVVGFNP